MASFIHANRIFLKKLTMWLNRRRRGRTLIKLKEREEKMAKITMHLSTEEVTSIVEKERTPVPVGAYSAQIFDSVLEESKKGRPMLTLSLRLVDAGEFTGKEFKNWCVLPHGSITSGLGNLLNAAKACGVDLDGDFDSEDFRGKEADINVIQKLTPDGNMRSEMHSFVV